MRNSEQQRVVVLRTNVNGSKYFLSGLSPQDFFEIPEERLDLPFLDPHHQPSVGSCRGLLLIFDYSGHLFLCNPTTKQFQYFPSKEPLTDRHCSDSFSFVTCGLGYDSKSDDYKILRVYEQYQINKQQTELYSLKNNTWKVIPNPDPLLLNHYKYTYVRGRCYWRAGDCYIASFDFTEERFSYFYLPKYPGYKFEFVPVDGEEDLLGVLCYRDRGLTTDVRKPGQYYEFWVWREASQCWDKMFNVALGGVGGTTGMIDGRFLFLHGIYDNADHCYSQRLAVYDWTRRECKELGIYDHSSPLAVFSYVESTVALPYGKPISGSQICNYHRLEWGKLDLHLDRKRYRPIEDFGSEAVASYNQLLDDLRLNGFRIIHDDFDDEEEEKQLDIGPWDSLEPPNYDELLSPTLMNLSPTFKHLVRKHLWLNVAFSRHLEVLLRRYPLLSDGITSSSKLYLEVLC